jgi:hypothetical protein
VHHRQVWHVEHIAVLIIIIGIKSGITGSTGARQAVISLIVFVFAGPGIAIRFVMHL